MTIIQQLGSLLLEGVSLRLADTDIYSVIPAEDQAHLYDQTAAIYDLLIGNGAYNRLVWGNWPSAYAAYCARALGSSSQGLVLDAGCGTLVFTAPEYLRNTGRPIVLLDRSLGMLKKARERLLKGNKIFPEHIILLQGDIFALPFKPASFETVLSWGTLHLFDTPSLVLNELTRVTAEQGRMFFTSLVTGRLLGARYLNALYRAGHVATPMSAETLMRCMTDAGLVPACSIRGNMAYCDVSQG